MFENYLKNQISLEEGESIQFIVRHHWATFAKTFLKILFLPILTLAFISVSGIDALLNILNSNLLSFISFAVFIFWATFSFYHWFIWYFDLTIITNKRILIIDQKGIFEKIISETSLNKIQDLTCSMTGLLPTIFRFGNLKIQTAGENPNFILKNVPTPNKVQSRILHIKHIEESTD